MRKGRRSDKAVPEDMGRAIFVHGLDENNRPTINRNRGNPRPRLSYPVKHCTVSSRGADITGPHRCRNLHPESNVLHVTPEGPFHTPRLTKDYVVSKCRYVSGKMEPEKGDPTIRFDKEDIVRALRSVGVVLGDTVMFHSSLSSMGYVIGGANTVIGAFLEAVGSGGTVAVPTLCQRDKEKRFEMWDILRSPSDVGVITEAFRLRPDAIRSDHPTHSVAAIGTLAEELTRDHKACRGRLSPWGDGAFAKYSPWDKLYQRNASYVFIGVDFTVNTMQHFIQSLIVERALESCSAERRQPLASEISGWLKDGVWPYYDDKRMEALHRTAGLMHYGKIGSATLRRIRARDMVDNALQVLESHPREWFDEKFLDWYGRACGSPM